MKMKMKVMILGALFGAIMVAPANALVFTISDVDVTALSSDPGLVIETSNVLGTPYNTPDMNVGDMYYISRLFTIGTNETAVNPDDEVAYPITVAMTFSSPPASGTIDGDTFGTSDPLVIPPYIYIPGFFQSGQVVWAGPVDIAFGYMGTGLLRVQLEDVTFAFGIGGLNFWDEKDVKAKLTYLQAPVPEPATLLLMGFGLAGVGAAARRRKRAA